MRIFDGHGRITARLGARPDGLAPAQLGVMQD
jgi:hypothetical protein